MLKTLSTNCHTRGMLRLRSRVYILECTKLKVHVTVQVAAQCREEGAEVDIIPADLSDTKNADTLAKT